MRLISRNHLFLIVSFWSIVHIALLSHLGIRPDLYDSKGYSDAAEFFLEHGRFEVFHQIFYALPILLIAVFKVITVDYIVAFVLFQCLLSGFAALCLYRAASVVFNDQNAGLISALIFICWWDVVQWNTTIMTESIACSITCLVILSVANFSGARRDYAMLILLLTACILIRPTGVLLIFGAFVFLIAHHWSSLKSKRFAKGLVLGSFAIISLSGAAFMFQYWDLTEQYHTGNIITYMDTIEGQLLYDDNLRMNTFGLMLPDPQDPPLWKVIYFAWNNPIHFGSAAIQKVFYLVTGIRPYFSHLHNIYTLTWLGVIYSLFYLGFRSSRNHAVRYFSMSVIVANCLLIAVAAVDWDNRFYVPMQPGIALLAGGGGAYCYRYLKLRKGRILRNLRA